MGITLSDLTDRLHELQRRDRLFHAYMQGDINHFPELKESYPTRQGTAAVEALLVYIDDTEVSAAFRSITDGGGGLVGSQTSSGLHEGSASK